MASLLRVGRGFENSWSHGKNNALTEKWLEKMVKAGKLPESALQLVQLRNAERVQTTVVTSRPAAEVVPQYKKSRIPVAREATNFLNEVRPSMPSMSLGRARWSTADGSIFSVADGRRLAQEPVRQPTPFEAMRQNRVAKATLETPLIAGMRLLPIFTPGRAMMWGTILAMWGTGALVMSSTRALGISRVEEAEEKLRGVLKPSIDWVSSMVSPLKSQLTFESMRGPADANTDFAQLTRALKVKLSKH